MSPARWNHRGARVQNTGAHLSRRGNWHPHDGNRLAAPLCVGGLRRGSCCLHAMRVGGCRPPLNRDVAGPSTLRRASTPAARPPRQAAMPAPPPLRLATTPTPQRQVAAPATPPRSPPGFGGHSAFTSGGGSSTVLTQSLGSKIGVIKI